MQGSITAGATGLLVIWTDIAPEYEIEFNEWYDKEIPQLLDVPGFQTGRRYQAVDGKPKYMAIYQFADENVLKSDAFRAVREIRSRGPERLRRSSGICSAGSSGRFSRMGTLRTKMRSSR